MPEGISQYFHLYLFMFNLYSIIIWYNPSTSHVMFITAGSSQFVSPCLMVQFNPRSWCEKVYTRAVSGEVSLIHDILNIIMIYELDQFPKDISYYDHEYINNMINIQDQRSFLLVICYLAIENGHKNSELSH